jgi:hypothetical protein
MLNPPLASQFNPLLAGPPNPTLNINISGFSIPNERQATMRECRVLRSSEVHRALIRPFTWVGSFVEDKAMGVTRIVGEENSSVAIIDQKLSSA